MTVREWSRKDSRCLLLIAGVVSVPLMTNYCLDADSLPAALSQISRISQGIGNVFPIRTGTLGTLDFGYSGASFQANVFYLIPALLYRLGIGLGHAYKWTLFLLNVMTAVIAYFSFRGCSDRWEIGWIGSMLYTWCPYRCSEMYLSGDLGELAAWTFLPLIAWGLKCLYVEDEKDGIDNKAWVILAWGFSLLTISSTVFLSTAAVMTAITMLVMGRKTLRRKTVLTVGRAIAVVLAVNAWFLVPMLLRLRDASAVAPMLVQDMQSKGMYFTQYLMIFCWTGSGTELPAEGMTGAQAMGPGAAVILLILIFLWAVFTKKYSPQKGDFAKRMMWVSVILMILSTNAFPWNYLQGRNMLCSIVLALLYTPAKLGIEADLCLILITCLFLSVLGQCMSKQKEGEKAYQYLLLAIVFIAFSTTQFQLGNILITQGFVRYKDIPLLAVIDFPLLTQESVIWRFSEAVSAVALCGCLVMYIVRRRNIEKM